MASAARLVDEYLKESLAVSPFAPRLPEVPAARRLYAAPLDLRYAVARECARRVTGELDRPYYLTTFMWSSWWRRMVQELKQRLFPKRHGLERIMFQHRQRYADLYKLMLFRLPARTPRDVAALLQAAPPDGMMFEFPLRATYRALVRCLDAHAATPELDREVERHLAVLREHAEHLPEPADDSLPAKARALRGYRAGLTDFEEYRWDVDPDELPDALKALAPFARTWGMSDDGARTEFIHLTTTEAQHRMWRAVDARKDELEAYLGGEPYRDSGTGTAMLYLSMAYREVDAPDDA
jgi:hypothetical protein